MIDHLTKGLKFITRIHLFGSLFIVSVIVIVISLQVSNRTTFANTELYQDVMDRWGAPITQPAPSVRYVNTGSVFTDLQKLPLASQKISIDADMNYRKRGLVYFSGFNFNFCGEYSIVNDKGSDIDVVFVFPINLQKNKVLLSDLAFYINDKLTDIGLTETSDKLVWTGRLPDKKNLSFKILYKGRGLDQFNYQLDPSMPVKNFTMTSNISGGTNFDYAPGVIPATKITPRGKKRITLEWQYKSLESGVPVGLILPSEKTFSMLIATLTKRGLVTFVLFFIGFSILPLYFKKSLRFYESYLIAACYGFFYVLLAYLAAFLNFYAAYFMSLIIIALLLYLYTIRILSLKAGIFTLALTSSFLFIPTMAVILQGYTGLIYTLEILLGLAVIMWSTTQKPFKDLFEESFGTPNKGALK